MKNRFRKKILYARSKSAAHLLWEIEADEWDNMIPIGREFGSKDYERLVEHDNAYP